MNQNTHNKINQKLDRILELLGDGQVLKPLALEDNNFRVSSVGWHKIEVDGKLYLESPEKDAWEFLEGDYKGEQLFTWDAAMRETKGAGKIIPSDEQLTEILGDKDNLKNITYPGYRGTNGTFVNLGSLQDFWSSTPSGGSSAWGRYLFSIFSTVYRTADSRAYGFSVRCLKDLLENKH
jgi:hypothetical protein